MKTNRNSVLKRRIAGMIGLCGLFAGGAALADDSGFYAGAMAGRSSTSTPPNLVLSKSTDTVYGVLGGYQFTRNWGAEAFYTEGGSFSGVNLAGSVAGSGKADIWGVDAVGTLPLSDGFSLYGKLGLANVNTSISTVPASTLSGATRTAVTYGLGGQYNVTSSFGLRLGWDRYGAETSGATGVAGSKDHYNINVYSLAGVFKF
jgi:OmpA-OmpF porin, OOP family